MNNLGHKIEIPEIDTSRIPAKLMVPSGDPDIARSLAQLDQIGPKQIRTRDHHDAVMQLIADCNNKGINIVVSPN